MAKTSFTAILEKEGDQWVALVEQATSNLREAVELLLECADPAEIDQRLHAELFAV